MTVVACQQQVGAGCRLGGVAESLDLGVGLGDAAQGRACCREPRVAVDATLAVGGSDSLGVLDIERNGHHPVWRWAHFTAHPWRQHYVCIENGAPDGSRRAAHVIVWKPGEGIIVNPSDFQPHSNPPAVVIKSFDAWFVNFVVVKLFGDHPPEKIRVDFREE